MHPVIKVVTFLVAALFLTRAQLWGISLTLLLLLFLYLRGLPFDPRSTWRMLRRMRWLFLSILVTYLWFTPGAPMFPAFGHYSPSIEGVIGGAQRIVTLVLIVVQVGLLLHTTSREELVGAIRRLAAPLQLLGLNRDRLALRLMLILESVEEVQLLLTRQMAQMIPRRKGIGCIADSLAAVYREVVRRAEVASRQQVVLIEQGWPPWQQWSYPLILVLLFSWGAHI